MLARRLNALPLTIEDGAVLVAIDDPSDVVVLDDVRAAIGAPVKFVVTSPDQLRRAIDATWQSDLDGMPLGDGFADESLADAGSGAGSNRDGRGAGGEASEPIAEPRSARARLRHSSRGVSERRADSVSSGRNVARCSDDCARGCPIDDFQVEGHGWSRYRAAPATPGWPDVASHRGQRCRRAGSHIAHRPR